MHFTHLRTVVAAPERPLPAALGFLLQGGLLPRPRGLAAATKLAAAKDSVKCLTLPIKLFMQFTHLRTVVGGCRPRTPASRCARLAPAEGLLPRAPKRDIAWCQLASNFFSRPPNFQTQMAVGIFDKAQTDTDLVIHPAPCTSAPTLAHYAPPHPPVLRRHTLRGPSPGRLPRPAPTAKPPRDV